MTKWDGSKCSKMKALPNVETAAVLDNEVAPDEAAFGGFEDEVYTKLHDVLGVRPYAEFAEANLQLLTNTREDADGNRYLYVYNYCDGSYHEHSAREEIRDNDHGTNIKTEIRMDGTYIPYSLDASAGAYTSDEGMFIRATETGSYTTKLSDGTEVTSEISDGKGGTILLEGKDEYTGGINLMKPVFDAVPYLRDGENTIEIEYSSDLTNIMLAKGVITAQSFGEGEGWSKGTWWGKDVAVRAYGLVQAKIIPYVDEQV